MIINQYSLDNDIKFLAKSEIRLKILSELQKKPKSVKELEKLQTSHTVPFQAI